MNTQWQAHLQKQGAIFENEDIRFHEPGIEAESAAKSNVLADLSRLGIIRVTGEDAESFLQNQFSSDVREVNQNNTQLSSYCNPKGRILATFRLIKDGDGYLLVMPREIIEPTLKRLRMFVLRSKVILENYSDDAVIIGASGTSIEELLKNQLTTIPVNIDGTEVVNGIKIVRVPGSSPRFVLVGEPERTITLWETLSRDVVAIGHESWRLLDIRAGLPEIGPETVEAFVPQMVNLQALGGVSFKKGCYPGQEIVARMHYLGKLKRRMYKARLQSDQAPLPGVEIYAEGSSEQSAGKLVESALSPEGGYELLAVLQIAQANETLHLGAADGPILNLEELPYTLD